MANAAKKIATKNATTTQLADEMLEILDSLMRGRKCPCCGCDYQPHFDGCNMAELVDKAHAVLDGEVFNAISKTQSERT